MINEAHSRGVLARLLEVPYTTIPEQTSSKQFTARGCAPFFCLPPKNMPSRTAQRINRKSVDLQVQLGFDLQLTFEHSNHAKVQEHVRYVKETWKRVRHRLGIDGRRVKEDDTYKRLETLFRKILAQLKKVLDRERGPQYMHLPDATMWVDYDPQEELDTGQAHTFQIFHIEVPPDVPVSVSKELRRLLH